jgi:integrase/recombinase XerD
VKRIRGLTLRAAKVVNLRAWADALTGAPRTRARRVSAIKSLFGFGHSLGYLGFNVAGAIKPPKISNDLAERIVSVEAVRALIGAAAGRDRALFAFLYISGARLEEACQLQWKHAHPLPDGRATITLHGKGGKTRHVLVSAELVVELERLRCAGDDEAHVFASRSGRALHPSNVRALLARHAKRPGLRRVSPHCFRHAHASHALDNGAPVHTVQATLGHASLSTTSRYVHAKPMDSAGMYLRL